MIERKNKVYDALAELPTWFMRTAMCPWLLICASVTCTDARAHAMQEVAPASITTIAESATAMTLRFTDARAAHMTIEFKRTTSTAAWTPPADANGSEGIVFGRTNPVYASIARQRAQGITAEQAITTLTSAISTRPLTDITIFRLGATEMAIGLWQGKSITEIWFVGALVGEMLTVVAPGGWSFCDRALRLCCRSVPNPTPAFGEPANIPQPRIGSCKFVARICGEAAKEAACDCLHTACEFCFTEPEYCCGDDPPTDPPTGPPCPLPWLPADSEDACVTGVEICVTPPESPAPAPPGPLTLLLDEIANRLQACIDLQNAQAT